MATVRVLAKRDVPPRVFACAHPGYRQSSQAREAHFREMVFDCRDVSLPRGWPRRSCIAGCYALQPRPMLHAGRPIRVARAASREHITATGDCER
jgi:hypothetical protein